MCKEGENHKFYGLMQLLHGIGQKAVSIIMANSIILCEINVKLSLIIVSFTMVLAFCYIHSFH